MATSSVEIHEKYVMKKKVLAILVVFLVASALVITAGTKEQKGASTIEIFS